MRIVKTIEQLRKILDPARQKGQTIGFVPTMGSFHEGHMSLVRRAKKENDLCVVSIYVNPTQFGPKEDFKNYPRDIKHDSSMLFKENVDILFFPSNNVIYPNRYLTYIDVENVSDSLCGRFRPGHFRGVATIVAKLLNIVQPDVMYLGQKDAQQVVVLKAMVRDLNFSSHIQVVPNQREKDGLAMSSRNKYLSDQERGEAGILYKSLQAAKQKIDRGEASVARIVKLITSKIQKSSSGKIQYVECVDADNLATLKRLKGKVLIAVAVYFGKTRLIDNLIVPVYDKKQIKS